MALSNCELQRHEVRQYPLKRLSLSPRATSPFTVLLVDLSNQEEWDSFVAATLSYQEPDITVDFSRLLVVGYNGVPKDGEWNGDIIKTLTTQLKGKNE